jgi:negative regulator of sigma E activity
MINEQTEFLISQYLDGTIGELDRRVLEEKLRDDAEVRLVLAQYQHVETLMRGSRELPNVDFGKFSAHLSAMIAEEEAPVAQPMRLHAGWTRWLAIAAGLALFAGVGLHFIPKGSDTVAQPGTMVVTGPAVETAHQPVVSVIAVGPTQDLANRGMTLGMADDAIAAPSPRVSISAASAPASNDDRVY